VSDLTIKPGEDPFYDWLFFSNCQLPEKCDPILRCDNTAIVSFTEEQEKAFNALRKLFDRKINQSKQSETQEQK